MSSRIGRGCAYVLALCSCFLFPGYARLLSGATLTVIVDSKGERPKGRIRVIATPQSAAASVSTQEVLGREAPIVLDLSRGLWIIRAFAEGFWGAPQEIRVEQDLQVSAELWPATEIRAEIASDASPPSLTGQFRSSPSFPTRLAGEETCPIEKGTWRCSLPSGVLDFSLRAEGFVPQYRWGVTLAGRASLDLGRIALVQGASVSGFVAADRGSIIPSRCRVRLGSEQQGPGLPRPLEVGVNGRGFFQFENTLVGRYVVVARCEGFDAISRAVTVLERRETSLHAPLVLGKASFLELTFIPPRDPEGLPWVVEIAELEGQEGRRSLGSGPIGRDGVFRKEGLNVGDLYQIVVTTASHQNWWAENLTLSEENHQRTITLGVHRVRGTVRIGNKPLSASLWFGGEHEVLRHQANSDQDGHFKVTLPRLGPWQTTVEADDPTIKADVKVNVALGDDGAKAEIVLPSTFVTGTVVDETGRAVEQAVLTFRPSDAPTREILQKVVAGSFRLEGVPAGSFIVRASKGRSSSEPVEVKIEEDSEGPPLTLVLRKSNELEIRVVGPSGSGVPYALVIPKPTVEMAVSYGVPKTDASGRLTLPVPPQLTELNFVVLASGFALRIFRAPVKLDEPLVIPVSPTGGSLQLEIPWENRQGASARLANAATDVPIAFLINRGWTRVQPGKVVLPLVEPGEYSVCAGADCDSGFLPAGQILTLRPFHGKMDGN